MDDAKRRALIKAQAAKKKESDDAAPSATIAINPSIKRKFAPKGDRQAKKPKVSLEPIVGLMAEGKMATPVKHGATKGFMKAPSNLPEKPPVLLHETPSMPWSRSRPSSLRRIMRIWETTPRRPWGSPTSLQSLR